MINNGLFASFNFNGNFNNDDEKRYDGVLRSNYSQCLSLFNNALYKSIDIWLDNLKSDLDDLNIDHLGNFQLDIKTFVAKSNNLRILSESFYKNAIRLNYIWVQDNHSIIDSAGDELLKLVKQYEINKTLRNEKHIHNCLKTHSHVLRGEDYNLPIYEKQLYYNNSRKYIESDFINPRFNYSWYKNQSYEVKLPSERFVKKKNHDILLASFKKFTRSQVAKYQEYLTNEQNLKHMTERFNNDNINILNQQFEFAILIGRDAFKEENIYLVNKETTFHNFQIDLITYDDIIRKHEHLYQRLKRFSIS